MIARVYIPRRYMPQLHPHSALDLRLLSIKVLLKRNGKFSSQHVHDNPGLRKQGIHCVMDQDREARERNGAY